MIVGHLRGIESVTGTARIDGSWMTHPWITSIADERISASIVATVLPRTRDLEDNLVLLPHTRTVRERRRCGTDVRTSQWVMMGK